MKRKEAIKKLRQGSIQIENDLLPSTKEIKKILKKAFPKGCKASGDTKYYKIYINDKTDWEALSIQYTELPIVKLSSITKPKNKLKQLEKGYSELCKDICENNNKITNKQKELEDRIIDLERSVSFLNNNNIDSENPLQSPVKTFEPDFENLSENLEEINKWYKHTHPKNMFIGFVIGEKEGKYIGYGLNYIGDWHTKEEFSIDNLDQLMEATPQEVEQALITEAKKRGFDKGVKFIESTRQSGTYGEKGMVSDNFYYDNYANGEKVLLSGGRALFCNGVWANILEETPINEDEIDWSNEQLLKSKYSGSILISTGKHSANTFEGIMLFNEKGKIVSEFAENWGKEGIELFKGTLTINKE